MLSLQPRHYGWLARRLIRLLRLEVFVQDEATLKQHGDAMAALNAGVVEKTGMRKRAVAVKDTRRITKAGMIHNDYQPVIEVDPQTYQVRADGELLVCEPAAVLPLAQRYFLF